MNRQTIRSYLSPDTTLRWGIRMGIVSVVPIIWGIATDHPAAADWITLAAECACWIELKGTAGQRVRVLLLSTLLAVVSGVLGTLSKSSDVAGIVLMFLAGFAATTLKSLGERGSGLAICIFLMVIIGNAIPFFPGERVADRALWMTIGGLWNAAVGLAFTLLLPVRHHYRSTIAGIWKGVAALATVLAKGQDGRESKSGLRSVYLAEKSLRDAINNSLHFHTGLAGSRGQSGENANLATIRKRAALLGAHLVAIYTEFDTGEGRHLPPDLRRRVFRLVHALGRCAHIAAAYTTSLRPADATALASAIADARSSLELLRERPETGEAAKNPLQRVVRLGDRAIRLVADAYAGLLDVRDRPVYRAIHFSLEESFLHPRVWWPQLRLLLAPNSSTLRFSFRAALASAVAMGSFLLLDLPRGYWMAFTVMVVLQPHFGATLRKAGERIAGTTLGILLGSVLLTLPGALYLKEALLFTTAVMMVTFVRNYYTVSSVFITLNVVLLFSVVEDLDSGLLLLRLTYTIIGAAIAVIAGFAFLPVWDTEIFPRHVARALQLNAHYLRNAFLPPAQAEDWVTVKRRVETENTNAFDSFNRSILEPKRSGANVWIYTLLQHNVRITRDVTALQVSREEVFGSVAASAEDSTLRKEIDACFSLFRECLALMEQQGWIQRKGRDYLPPSELVVGHDVFYVQAVRSELRAMVSSLHHHLPTAPLEEEGAGIVATG